MIADNRSKARTIMLGALAGVIVALVFAAMPSTGAAADVTAFVPPLPTVSGPIASTPNNFPYIADGFDVMPPVPKGYVEDEYFFSGTGSLYEYTSTGIEVVTPCPASVTEGTDCTGIPYETRMIVKRPKNPHKFSGTVIIEPLNPTASFDIAGVWDRSVDYFVRNGDVFVGWTSKSITVQTLKAWNSTRYTDLNWPYVPSPYGSTLVADGIYDGITFDIAAQLGRLFKENGPTSPLYGYNVKRVFEAGFSQDGGFTFTQADVFNALERMPDGGPIYDGYVPGGTGGPIGSINFGLTLAGALSPTDPRNMMQPRDVPVIQTNTQTEVFLGTLGAFSYYRRPDSNAANDEYRLWEVPGGSHISNDLADPVITLQLDQAELQGITAAELSPIGCTHMQFIDGPVTGLPGVVDPNPYPFAYAVNAAFADLTRWVTKGTPAPEVDRITLSPQVTAGSIFGTSIVYDSAGNAEGGFRTPFVDVPTGTYVPFDTASQTTEFSAFCVLYGYELPFDGTTLGALYKNHGAYVHRVARETNRLVKKHMWLQADGVIVKTEAAQASVP
jgi:Alpha/beta hydrolase domain